MAKMKRAARQSPDFHRQTVLFQWALAQLGVADLKEFKERYQVSPDSAEGLDERTGLHRFFETIAGALPIVAGGRGVGVDRLREYEEHILEHTQAINAARVRHNQPRIDWKYHQYLALLFTEMFLDRYFEDPAELRAEINAGIAEHNAKVDEVDRVEPFSLEPRDKDDGDPRRQLSRLAFWCATGSGKTLLMHVHVRQFRHYHANAHRSGRWPKLDQIILVTPNDGLSEQHATEFTHSGFDVVTVAQQGVEGLFSDHARRAIKILSIHKLQEEHGKETVATEAFEGCNLILVDEGHRGAGRGEDGKWMERRDQLGEAGFTFEYSATFKEAIATEKIRSRYARSILFDYSYRSFYRDGYGKDFTILNLEDDDKQRRYLTAAVLLFYQQMWVWLDGGEAIRPFQVDKPLWVFVGHTVASAKAKTEDDKVSVSDVVDVLLFVRTFLADRAGSIGLIRSLLSEGFVDQHGRDILAGRLPHIDVSGDKDRLANDLFDAILRDVFHAPGGGVLRVQLLRGAEGEVALQVGEGDPFGVVNVGDPLAVVEACEKNDITRVEDDQTRGSLFSRINRDDSPINLLVGSRKFTEGWNSWRVSSIGLMRMGKGEGTQIIQLFGRGVRLRGYRMSLRRSAVLAEKPPTPANLRQVETLQIFGIKASYMSQFRDWIYGEVPEAQEKQVWELPVVKNLPSRKLKTLQLREEIEGVPVDRGNAFRKLGPLVRLRPPDPTSAEDAWLRQTPTKLNWLPRIAGVASERGDVTSAIGQVRELPRQSLKRIPIFLFNVEALLFGLEAYKATRGLDRLHVDRAAVVELLERDDWYELLATPDDMRLDRYENRGQWQRMAQQLLNSYAERLYRFIRGRWEAPYIEVVEMSDEDPSMVETYSIETTDLANTRDQVKAIAAFVKELVEAVGAFPMSAWRQLNGRWRTVPFAGHLYQPLMHVGRNAEIRISPVALDQWEAQLVEDLRGWSEKHQRQEIFLLRNRAVTGLGFFQAANFFPDFLLWVLDGELQHLAFVDPKGLHHFDPSHPKIQFATRDIPRLQAIVAQQAKDLRLHAFIVSNTPYASLDWSHGGRRRMTKAEIEALGVLFQADDSTTYIQTLMEQMTRG